MAASSSLSQASDQPVDWAARLQQHGRWIRTVLLARSGEPGAVEELFQETALAAVAQENQPVDSEKIAPWLYRVALRQALLYRRKLGRTRRLNNNYADHISPSEQDRHEPDPLEWLLAEERRQLVRTALEKLNRRDAEILLLKYTEHWSYRQLAGHLGATESAIEARLHRARQRLREHLTALNVVEVPQ